MHNPTILFAGAGDIAQRTAPLLPKWHTIALSRSVKKETPIFNHHIQADLTQLSTLKHLSPEYVVFTATPATRDEQSYKAIYQTGLRHLMQRLDKTKLKRFLFISSTAIYGALPTPQNELSTPAPASFNGQIILGAEQWLRNELGHALCVLRFSGLYGPGRDYLQRALLAQKARINPAADNFANRIHIDDAARSCAHLLTSNHADSDYIATDCTALSQNELYHFVAQKIHAAPPILDASIPYQSKHFSNQRLVESGFQFLYPSTIDGYDCFL